jgi:hypothetical protein
MLLSTWGNTGCSATELVANFQHGDSNKQTTACCYRHAGLLSSPLKPLRIKDFGRIRIFRYVAKKVFATMNERDEGTVLEQRLIREIEGVDQQIRGLQQQRSMLETLLLKARRENVATRTVSRRNSVGRILVETVIIEALKAAKRPLNNFELHQAVRLRDPTVKDTTFRSHLHRLAQRDQIVRVAGRRGVWKAAPDHS